LRRDFFIEAVRRQIHSGFPSDDSDITINLVNTYIEPAIGIAAKACYDGNLQVDGVGYVSNGFYTTFKNLSITSEGNFLWKTELPEIPQGLGAVDGISRFVIKDDSSPQTSYPVLLLSENQVSIQKGMRAIPNKLIGYPEGKYLYIQSTLILSVFTGQVTMISGGDKTDLDSELNVPPTYLPVMQKWILEQLMIEKMTPKDVTNDGQDGTNFQ
jgi:hypothetical protein